MDDDYMYYTNGRDFAANVFIEEEDREPTPTGILSKDGNMIMRLYPPKPKFGFPIFPEDNQGYEYDTELDYMYTELT